MLKPHYADPVLECRKLFIHSIWCREVKKMRTALTSDYSSVSTQWCFFSPHTASLLPEIVLSFMYKTIPLWPVALVIQLISRRFKLFSSHSYYIFLQNIHLVLPSGIHGATSRHHHTSLVAYIFRIVIVVKPDFQIKSAPSCLVDHLPGAL